MEAGCRAGVRRGFALALVAAAGAGVAGGQAAPAKAAAGASRQVTPRQAALAFEPNVGQAPELSAGGRVAEAKFFARSGGYVARLGAGGVSLEFTQAGSPAQKQIGGKFAERSVPQGLKPGSLPASNGAAKAVPLQNGASNGAADRAPLQDGAGNGPGNRAAAAELNLTFRGANGAVAPAGEERLKGVADYFPTGNPRDWKTNVPTYGRVQYKALYPGIDLSFYGSDGRLEYDVDVAAGADPAAVRLALDGQSAAAVNAAGDLVLTAGEKQLRFLKPVAYQLGPDGRREPVEARYRMSVARAERGAEDVSFAVGKYDRSRPLVIDPVLVYGEFPPTYSNAGVNAIAADASGNLYLAETEVPDQYNTATVQKLDPNGNVLFTAQFGSGSTGTYGFIIPNGIAFDSAGNIVVAGQAYPSAVPTTAAAYQQNGANNVWNAFVAEIKADGSALTYASYLSGTSSNYGSYATGAAVDAQGKIYVTGYTQDSTFPTTGGAYQAAPSGNSAYFGFVAKFDPTQSGAASLVYSTAIAGCSAGQTENAIAVDGSGDAYVTGATSGGGFAATPGAYAYSGTAGQGGVYVTELNPTGTALVMNANLGPGYGNSIAVDGSGAVYVTGQVTYNDYPVTAGAWQTQYPAGFATVLAPGGATLVYSTFLNGPSGYAGAGIVPDTISIPPGCASSCVATIAGYTSAKDLPLVNPIQSFTNTSYAGFVIQLAATGASATFSTYLSGVVEGFSTSPYPMAAVDGSGNIYFAGNTPPEDQPVTVPVASGSTYVYVAKIGPASGSWLQFVPGSVNFGRQTVGVGTANYATPPTVVLRNVGSMPAQLETPLTFTDPEFTETDNCNGTIPAGGECTLTLNYLPTASGYPTATLTVNANSGAASAQLSVSGSAQDGSYLTTSLPNGFYFGSVVTGAKSTAQTVTLTNGGNQPYNFQGGVYVQPESNADSTTFPAVNNCPPQLNPKQSCQVSVQFAPSQLGYSVGYLQPTGIYFEGTGIAAGTTGSGSMTFSSSLVNFGTQVVGTASASQTTYVENTGVTPITVYGDTVTLTSTTGNAADFAVTQNDPDGNCYPSAPGTGNGVYSFYYQCNYSVVFTPSAVGTETATVTVTDSTSASPHTFTVSGVGVASAQTLESVPGNAVFAPQPVGYTSATQTFSFYNTGTAPMTISRVLATGDFQVVYSNFYYCAGATLQPQASLTSYAGGGGSCQVTVSFTPTATGARTGTLELVDSATGSPQTFSLVGTGITPTGSLLATPDTIVFGPQVTGTTSGGQSFTITNPGDSPVTINSITGTGGFSLVNGNVYSCTSLGGATPPFTLNAGWSCLVNVQFTPTQSSGTETGTLVFGTSAGNTTVNLSGDVEPATNAVEIYTSTVNFGTVKKGTTLGNAQEYGIYLYNAGTEPLSFNSAPAITGSSSSPAGDFSFYAPYYNGGVGQPVCFYLFDYSQNEGSIPPGQGCYAYFTFTPSKAAAETATLTFNDSAGTQTVTLTGTGAAAAPTVFADPATANFSYTPLTTSTQSTISLVNGGATGLTILSASITAGSSDFQIASGNDGCSGQIDPAGSYCNVTVTFQPSAAGLRTGTLTFKDQNAKTYTASLTGYAYAVVDLAQLDPAALAFTPQSVTATGGNGLQAAQAITLYNNGNLPLTVGTISGTDTITSTVATGDFTINAAVDGGIGSDACSGQTVSAGSTCTVYVGFVPATAGSKSGSLSFPVVYGDGTKATLTASFTGTAFAEVDSATLTPTAATFLDQTAGNPGNGLQGNSLQLTNTGSQNLTVGQLTGTDTIIGSATTGDFVAATTTVFGTQIGGGDYCSGQPVAPGAGCTVYVYFAPGTVGAKTGTIKFPVTFTDGSTTTLTATLSGNGVAAANGPVLQPGNLTFAAEALTVTDGNQQSITLTNQGNDNFTVGKLSGTLFAYNTDFYYGSNGNGCTQGTVLTHLQSCTVWVQFTPQFTGTRSGTLVFPITYQGATTAVNLTATLSGTGISSYSEISASETTVTFPNTAVGTESTGLNLVFSNRGSTAYTMNSTAISGADAGDFTTSDGCSGQTLYGNSNCTVTIYFTPGAAGARTATLTETDSAPGSPRTIALKGAGVTAGYLGFFPASLAFGQQTVGTGSAVQTVGVTNIGASAVTFTTDASTVPAQFAVVEDNCAGQTLNPGSTCTLGVIFSPASAAAESATIKVNAGTASSSFTATGTGVAALTSSITLAANTASAAEGSLFVLTASVKDSTSTPVKVGSVNFYDGTTLLGNAQIVGTAAGGGVVGTAVYRTRFLPAGANSLTAKYVGPDATGTASSAVTVTVTGGYASSASLGYTGTQGNYVLTATLAGLGPATPTGNVVFDDIYNNGTTTTAKLGTVALDAASLTQTFVPAASQALGANVNPYQPIAVDLNGDGILDLVEPANAVAGVVVLIGKGDGTFQAAQSISTYVEYIAVGDFNGDGKPDLAAATGTTNVTVFLGNGDGTFGEPAEYQATGDTYGIAVGDFDGDGKLDIAATDFSNNAVDILLGNGDGTFQTASTPFVGNFPAYIAVADVNGDGKLDLVVDNGRDNTVSVLAGNGNGTFQTQKTYATGNQYPYWANVATGDVNGDGHPDIVVNNYFDGTVSVLTGSATGAFTAQTPVTFGGNPTWAALGDVNGDGKLDLVEGDLNGTVSVALGNGNATFQTPVAYATPGGSYATVGIADFNGDGKPDIAVTSYSGSTSTVLLNTVTQTAVLSGVTLLGTVADNVTAVYQGDAHYASATSNTLTLPSNPPTGLATLTVTPSSGATGTIYTLTASVTYQGAPLPAGSVTFLNGNTALATLELVGASGTAVYQTSDFTVGTHSLTAQFNGTELYLGSTSLPVTITVTGLNPTATTIASTGVEGSYALTANVDGFGYGTPTGSVTFTDTTVGAALGTVPLTAASASSSFLPPVSYGTGQDPTQAILADVNNDGKLDMVVNNYDGTQFSVLLGKGDGTFQAAQSFGTVANGAYFSAVADVNGDGKLDVITANGPSISIFLGNGDGTFQAASPLTIAVGNDQANTLDTGDFNGDGKVDIVVGMFGGGNVPLNVYILLGNGDGTFAAPVGYATAGNPQGVVARDFNGDGKLDVAVVYGYNDGVALLTGNGDGTLNAAQTIESSVNASDIFSADVNGDGKPDLVLTEAEQGGTINVLLNQGGGNFSAPVAYATAAGELVGVAIGDVTGDGIPDIVLSNSNGGTLGYLAGNGDGTFKSAVYFLSGSSNSGWVAVGDFNGDGRNDVAAVNGSLDSVSVLLGSTTNTVSLSPVTLAGVGTDAVTATYNGDGNFSASTSTPLGLAAKPAGTTTTLVATPATAALGAVATLTATVADQNTNPVTGGQVAFYNGTQLLGTVSLVSATSGTTLIGTATLKTSALAPGANSVTAKYLGDSTDAPSVSSAQTVTLTGLYPTTTLFGVTGTSSDYTLTGYVRGNAPLSPTGTVTFTDTTASPNTVLGTATLATPATVRLNYTSSPAVGFSYYGYGVPVVVGDFNGDGIADMSFCNYGNVGVLLGSGNGAFQAQQNYPTANTCVGGQISGDFNRDGKLDLAYFDQNGNVGILLGNGDGTFNAALSYPAGGAQFGAVGDFNGDGKLDIVTTGYYSGQAYVLLGNGDGTFLPAVQIGGFNGPRIPAVGDFNGDGKLDVAIPEQYNSDVQILLGNGDGTFAAALPYGTGNGPWQVVAADLNHDGVLDLATGNVNGNTMSVMLGNGDGTFAQAASYATTGQPYSLAAADFNLSGYPDLVVSSYTNGLTQVFLNNGSGLFPSSQSYSTAASLEANYFDVAIGDFNGDGRPDFAALSGRGAIDVYESQLFDTVSITGITVVGSSGLHNAVASYGGDGNFAASTSTASQLTAAPVVPSLTFAAQPAQSVTYGTALSVVATLAGPQGAPTPTGKVTYTVDGGTAQAAALSYGAATLALGSSLNVGTHTLSVTYVATPIYLTTTKTYTLTVTQASQTVTLGAIGNLTYGAGAFGLSCSASSGLGVTYKIDSGPATVTASGVVSITGAGAVTVECDQAGNSNYAKASATQSFAVAQAPLTLTIANKTKVYGQANPAFTGTFSGLVYNDTLTATYSTTATATSGYGTYPITATLSGAPLANYAVTIVNGTLSVTKTVLTVTVNNATRVYGAADPAFTGTIAGLVNGDTITAVYSSTDTVTTPAGTYASLITATLSGAALANYSVTINGGTLTITRAPATITVANASRSYGAPNPAFTSTISGILNGDAVAAVYSTSATVTSAAGNYTISATLGGTGANNYTATVVPGTLTVGPASLYIAVKSLTKVYGSLNPTLSGVVTGLLNNDSIAVSYSTTATQYSPVTVAGYPITASISGPGSSNYTAVVTQGTLTVTQAQLTITENAATRLYGAANPAFTGTLAGVLNGDAVTAVYSTAATAASPVGTYPISAVLAGAAAGNYKANVVAANLTVTPAPLTVTAGSLSSTYGAAIPALTYTVSGFVNGDTLASATTGAPVLSTTATAKSSVGTYPVTAALGTLAATNYNFTFVAGTLTVTPAALTVAAINATSVYGGAIPAFTYTLSGFVNGDTASTATTGAASLTTTASSASPVGSYTITAAAGTLTAGNYTLKFVPGTLSIAKASLTVTANNLSSTYGSALPTLTYTASGFVNGDTAAKAITGAPSLTTTATASSPAGSYSITAAVGTLAAANYTFTFAPGTLTINKAVLTVTANSLASTYGSALPTLTYTYAGFVNGDTAATALTGTPSLTTTATASSPAGPYPITAAAGTLSSANYSFAFVAGTLTVGKATLTVAANSFTILYGQSLPAYTYTLSGFVNGDTATSATSGAPSLTSTATAKSGKGNYAITAAAGTLAAANYNLTFAPGTLTINAAPVTVTANSVSQVYGSALPTLTYTVTGLVNGDTPGTAFTGSPTLSTTATAKSGAGTYPITIGVGTFASANYSFVFVNGTLTVSPATLTVTANNQSSVYGAALPALTYTIAGFVNGDTAATAVTGTPALSTTATAASPAGTYAIVCGNGTLSALNYSFNCVNGTFTIGKAPLKVTANSVSGVYGSALPAFTATISGFVNGDTAATATTGAPSLTTTATAASPVGVYPIAAAAGTLAAANYTFTFAPGSFTIGKAPLTVTANTLSSVYGTAPPALTYSFTGLVNGDTAATATTGAPKLATTATAASPVGTYPILIAQGTLAATNYTISLVAGSLNVAPAPLTATCNNATRPYGAANPALTGVLTGEVPGDALVLTCSTTAAKTSVAGGYAITPAVGGVKVSDYTVTPVNGTLTVSPAVLTVTAAKVTSVYGAALPALTYTIAGFVNGDTAATAVTGLPALTTTAVQGSGAGVYPVTAALGTLAAANYTFAFAPGTLTITQATLTVTAKAATSVYGAALPAFTYALSGFVNGDTAATAVTGTPSLTTTATASSPVGSYYIIAAAGTLAAPNYKLAFVASTLTITRATLTVAANNLSSVYGAALPALTYGFSGFVNGDTAATAVTGAAKLTTTATSASGVASYPIAITYGTLAAPNYNFLFVNGTLSITKAQLTVTVANATRVYGAANPTFTGAVTGEIAGDNLVVTYSSAAAKTSSAGSYPITAAVTGGKAGNYNVTVNAGTLTVTQAVLTVTAGNATKAYGAALPTFTVAFSGFLNGDTAATAVTGAASFTTAATASSTPGAYPVTPGMGTLASTNYSFTFVNGTLTVTKAVLTVTANAASKVYGSALPTFTATLSGFVNGDTAATAVTGSPAFASIATARSAAGVYAIAPSVGTLASANYSFIYVNGLLTISKAVLTVTANNATKVYGGAVPGLTFTLGGLVNGDTTATAESGYPSLATTATAASPVGTYAITAGLGSLTSTNYTFTFVNGQLSVTQAALKVTASNATKVYGAALPTFTDTLSGFVNGDTAATAVTGAASLTTTATAASAAGTYPITAAVGTLASANYSFTFVNGTLTVTKAALTVTANNATMVYGSALPTFTDTLSGFVNGDTAATAVTGAASLTTTATSASAVGTYPITAAVGTLASANYSFTFVNGTLTITKAALTVTANNGTKVYGSALPAFTATLSGFVNGDTAATAVTGAAGFTTTATAKSAVGMYPITATGGTLVAKNYSFTFAGGQLTVTPAALKVTANNAIMAYGSALPTFTDTVSGYVNGDTAATAFTGAASLTTTATASSPAGAYPITPGMGTLASTNYSFTFVNGTLTVTKAVLTVTANAASKVYGAALPTFTATLSGFVNGDTAATAVTGSPAFASIATARSAAGVYAIAPSVGTLASANYSFIYVNGLLTISKAVLTVTANNATKVYGGAVPGLTFTLGGLVNGDTTATAESGYPSLATTATAASPVGTYAITAGLGSLTSTNYTFTFVNGQLSVTQAALKVTASNATKVYGAALPAFTDTLSGFVNGDTAATAVTGAASLTTTATAASAAGTYPITAAVGTLASANYSFTFVSGTLTVTKAALTLTATNATVVYDQPIPALGFTASGLVNGDTIATAITGTPAETTTATQGSAPGNYPIAITVGTAVSANYTLAFVNGTLTITTAGAAATPVLSPGTGTYSSTQTVTITDSTPLSTIYYTTNGTTPTTASTKYTGAISVSATETVEAIAVATGYTQSAVASAAYTIK